MASTRVLKSWAQKFIYAWLIFCIGGVGSFTYFDGLLPGHEHGAHPFHLSLFEEPAHDHNPLPPPAEKLAEQARQWWDNYLHPHTDRLNLASSAASGFDRFFTSGLSDGFLLSAASLKIFAILALLGSVRRFPFEGRSAWLLPPDKPPGFPG